MCMLWSGQVCGFNVAIAYMAVMMSDGVYVMYDMNVLCGRQNHRSTGVIYQLLAKCQAVGRCDVTECKHRPR